MKAESLRIGCATLTVADEGASKIARDNIVIHALESGVGRINDVLEDLMVFRKKEAPETNTAPTDGQAQPGTGK